MIANPVFSADFQTGFDAYERGDFATALKEWKPLAEQGDVEAQYLLAGVYQDRHDVNMGENNNTKDPIFIGDLIFPLDKDNFSQFIEINEGKLIYVNSQAGHAIFYEQYLLIKKCQSAIDRASRNYGLDDDYIFGHPNKDGKIYYQLIKEQNGNVSCGHALRIEINHATIGVLETGTGLAIYQIEGFFEVIRTGKWNDNPASYYLKSRDVKYERIEAAREQAAQLRLKNRHQ